MKTNDKKRKQIRSIIEKSMAMYQKDLDDLAKEDSMPQPGVEALYLQFRNLKEALPVIEEYRKEAGADDKTGEVRLNLYELVIAICLMKLGANYYTTLNGEELLYGILMGRLEYIDVLNMPLFPITYIERKDSPDSEDYDPDASPDEIFNNMMKSLRERIMDQREVTVIETKRIWSELCNYHAEHGNDMSEVGQLSKESYHTLIQCMVPVILYDIYYDKTGVDEGESYVSEQEVERYCRNEKYHMPEAMVQDLCDKAGFHPIRKGFKDDKEFQELIMAVEKVYPQGSEEYRRIAEAILMTCGVDYWFGAGRREELRKYIRNNPVAMALVDFDKMTDPRLDVARNIAICSDEYKYNGMKIKADGSMESKTREEDIEEILESHKRKMIRKDDPHNKEISGWWDSLFLIDYIFQDIQLYKVWRDWNSSFREWEWNEKAYKEFVLDVYDMPYRKYEREYFRKQFASVTEAPEPEKAVTELLMSMLEESKDEIDVHIVEDDRAPKTSLWDKPYSAEELAK